MAWRRRRKKRFHAIVHVVRSGIAINFAQRPPQPIAAPSEFAYAGGAVPDARGRISQPPGAVSVNDSFRIGIGQIPSLQGNIEHNLGLMEKAVDDAAGNGVSLLVFPELALTGYVVDERFSDLAIRLEGEIMDRLRKLSEKLDIVTGFIEETPRHIFHNSAVHLSGGEILHVHRKIYLPTYGMFDERRYYGAGWDVGAYDTPNIRAATLVCGDAWHLSLPYLAAHRGADLILIIAASSTTGLADTTPCDWAWKAMCSSYALTLSCFVVFANLANAEQGSYDFWGGSFVCAPDGRTIAESERAETDLVTCDLDPAALRAQRIRLPFRRDDSLAHTLSLGQRALGDKITLDRFHPPTPSAPMVPKPR